MDSDLEVLFSELNKQTIFNEHEKDSLKNSLEDFMLNQICEIKDLKISNIKKYINVILKTIIDKIVEHYSLNKIEI